MSTIYKKRYTIGDMATVKAMNPPVYSLPPGLPDAGQRQRNIHELKTARLKFLP
jgi:hypothetical protein